MWDGTVTLVKSFAVGKNRHNKLQRTPLETNKLLIERPQNPGYQV